MASSVGIGFRSVALASGVSNADLRSAVRALGQDPAVDAVLLQHPLPAPLDFYGAVGALPMAKDVDGVGRANLGALVAQHPVQAPAVARAVLAILRHYAIPVAGHRVAVLGRSSTVGLPLALLLASRGRPGDAAVTILHSAVPDLPRSLGPQEVVVSCAGRPGLLTRTVVPRGAAVVDVGLSSVLDPSTPNGRRAVGDADAASLDGWASDLTPTPGGVGPVTVAQLMQNVVSGWEHPSTGEP